MSELNHYSRGVRLACLGGAMTIVALAFCLGIRMFRKGTAQDVPDTVPAFTRQGENIVIPEGSPLRSRLRVEPVTVKNSPRVLQLPATAEADPARTINILPPVAGKVIKLSVRLGDHVEKDQPLAVIESGDLAQAFADDDKARSALKRTKSGLERARGVHESGGGSLKDVQQAEDDYAQAQAEYNRAEARLQEIGVSSAIRAKSRSLTIVAPLSGTVTTLTTASSAFANDPTASLMTISNLDSVWVTAMVPESAIAFIFQGQSVEVSFVAWPGQVFHGAVSFVSAVVEPDTRRTKVRISFANPEGRLKPNMFATAQFNIPQTSALFVPDSALLMNNDSITVLVEIEPWMFVRRSVLPGYAEGDGTRIDQGLHAGDRIVVRGGGLLND